ncbi:alpha-taxilin [Iris pallida]|uniref:Alpha-taxilin n=1 Tax=Iris pallida TaxID=29817 RepID=A0AAX6HA49_IRIPA|nr:alpha-taxilin [Iris pallida]
METSPVNHRLPEADSLPDGFVETENITPSPAAAAAAEEEDPQQPDDGGSEKSANDDGGNGGGGGAAAPRDYKDLDSSSESSGGVFIVPSPEDTHQTSQQETEGCMELHTAESKERLTDGSSECSNFLKENVGVKRKVGKRSVKSEKELLELTLKYQKVIAERDSAVAIRERLESLCRELQRQNKMLMDECQRVSSEGHNMRVDLSTKFNDTIKDVGIKLEEQKDECIAQLKENQMLREKLKHLANQYALSEEQFSQKLKQKMLELQLADLKIQQQQERTAQEQTQIQLYVEQVTQLLATEKNLRLQLAADGEKFQQFQDALLKSNEVFETFKQEMEKMAKLIKELKKENEFLKSKCEKSDIALLKLVEERELMKKQFEKVKNQKEKLESLCRSLQAERKNNTVASTTNTSTVNEQVKVGASDSEL